MLVPLLAVLLGPPAPALVPQCWDERMEDGVKVIAYRGDRACEHFQPPRRFSGIWLAYMEGFDFVEGARTVAEAKAKAPNIWLTIDAQSIVPAQLRRRHIGHAYRVTFVGRAARDMNRKPMEGYGHMGMSKGLVLVDRMLAQRELGPIP